MIRSIVGLLLAAALAAVATGCATKSPNVPSAAPPSDTADGQIGEAGALPTPTGVATTVPAPDPTLTTTGTGGPFVILTLNPGILLLPWPTPADCVTYDPASAAVVYVPATLTYQVKSGSTVVLSFKRNADATQALAVVKSYKQHCWVGRGNPRPNPESYTMDYWLSPVQDAPAVPSPDCFAHVAAELTAQDNGASGWVVRTNTELIASFDTKAQALDAILVMKHFNRHCWLGRGYSGSDRLKYIHEWFATV